MAWVKLEDTFAEHPKVQTAGDQAAWLYVSGLLYCSRALTDGFIPSAKVSQLTNLRRSGVLAERLVSVGLWEAVDGGYRVHDYLEHQQSSVDRKRERRLAAQRQQRRRHAAVTPTSRRDIPDVTPMSRVAEVEVEREVEREEEQTDGGRRRDETFEDFNSVGSVLRSVGLGGEAA